MKAAGGGRPSLTSIEAAPDEFLNPVCVCVCVCVWVPLGPPEPVDNNNSTHEDNKQKNSERKEFQGRAVNGRQHPH